MQSRGAGDSSDASTFQDVPATFLNLSPNLSWLKDSSKWSKWWFHKSQTSHCAGYHWVPLCNIVSSYFSLYFMLFLPHLTFNPAPCQVALSCRLIDHVTVSGSRIPMRVYTMDLDTRRTWRLKSDRCDPCDTGRWKQMEPLLEHHGIIWNNME